MKKVFVVLFLSLALLAGCVETPKEDPIIVGAEDETVIVGEDFDLLGGIIATDQDGNDITDDIEIEVVNELGEEVVFTTEIEEVFTITYLIEDSNGEYCF